MSLLDCLASSRTASCPRVITEIAMLGVAIESWKGDLRCVDFGFSGKYRANSSRSAAKLELSLHHIGPSHLRLKRCNAKGCGYWIGSSDTSGNR